MTIEKIETYYFEFENETYWKIGDNWWMNMGNSLEYVPNYDEDRIEAAFQNELLEQHKNDR